MDLIIKSGIFSSLLFLFSGLQGQAIQKIDNQQSTLIPFSQDGLYGYADIEGKVIIKPQYKDASLFGQGYTLKQLASQYRIHMVYSPGKGENLFLPSNQAMVSVDKKCKIIDVTGKVVAEMDSMDNEFCGTSFFDEHPELFVERQNERELFCLSRVISSRGKHVLIINKDDSTSKIIYDEIKFIGRRNRRKKNKFRGGVCLNLSLIHI